MEPLLLILLFVCHYLADYTHLSTPDMLAAKRVGYPYYPIFTHAAIHASLMHTVIAFYGVSNIVLLSCSLLQLSSHFIIDVLKGKMNVWFPSVANPANKEHWYIFGLDQLLHHCVIVAMWYIAK